MRHVDADGGHDADAEAPRGQRWYALVVSARVQDDHGCCPDEPVHGERFKPGNRANLAVRADKFVGVLIGDDRGDGGDPDHGESRCDPDESIGQRPTSDRSSTAALDRISEESRKQSG